MINDEVFGIPDIDSKKRALQFRCCPTPGVGGEETESATRPWFGTLLFYLRILRLRISLIREK
jgi:hypothetical protein